VFAKAIITNQALVKQRCFCRRRRFLAQLIHVIAGGTASHAILFQFETATVFRRDYCSMAPFLYSSNLHVIQAGGGWVKVSLSKT
jgi:hypothetical protein